MVVLLESVVLPLLWQRTCTYLCGGRLASNSKHFCEMEILGAIAMAMYVWFLSVVVTHNFKGRVCIYSLLRATTLGY